MLPYAVKLFKQWTFFADPAKVNPFNPKGKPVAAYKNVVSGSFSYKKNPISILVSNGKTIRPYACHYWLKEDGKNVPESVLWYNKDGTYGISQVAFDWELPDRENILWAIGGAGLKEGDANKERFTGTYSDVWRKTSHIVVGFDGFGLFTAVAVSYMNGRDIKKLVNKLGLTHAILLDGGHVTAWNVDGVKYNTKQAQYYGIYLGG